MNSNKSAASTGQLAAYLADFAKSLKCDLFADRGTDVKAALDYALEIAQATDNPPAVTTAVFVVTNTIANLLAEVAEARLINVESENV